MIRVEDAHLSDVSITLEVQSIVNILKRIVSDYGFSLGDIVLIFGDDDWLIEYNRSFLDHDYYTDIITFDYSTADTISGDLLISIDRVVENANNLNVSRETELCRVCIHGVLHLVGLKDASVEEKNFMRSKENEYLSLLPN